jgi:hypothetical protein
LCPGAHHHGHVRAGRENAIGRREVATAGGAAKRSEPCTNDVGLVDTVTIGALLEQIRELVIQP